LNGALRQEFVRPGSGPPRLLPSITGKPARAHADEHLRYLDQINPANPQAASSAANAPAARSASPADLAAGLAGVDPTNPRRPAPQPTDRLPGLVSNEPMPD